MHLVFRHDRPNYVPGLRSDIKSGSAQGRLSDYFNTACFVSPPVIGADGVATAFGDAPIGQIHGPSEANFDLSAAKRFGMSWPRDGTFLEFRADFFNAFNHPIFGDPSTNFGSSSFGQITSTIVNPRVIQFALKYAF